MVASLGGAPLQGLLLAASLAITCLMRQPPGDGGQSGGEGAARRQSAGAWQPWGERGRPNRRHRIVAGLFAAVAQVLTSVRHALTAVEMCARAIGPAGCISAAARHTCSAHMSNERLLVCRTAATLLAPSPLSPQVFKSDRSREALNVFLQAEATILIFLIGIPALANEAWLDRHHLLYNFACRVAWANTGRGRTEHALRPDVATACVAHGQHEWLVADSNAGCFISGTAVCLCCRLQATASSTA